MKDKKILIENLLDTYQAYTKYVEDEQDIKITIIDFNNRTFNVLEGDYEYIKRIIEDIEIGEKAREVLEDE